jgi:hypothetical protein
VLELITALGQKITERWLAAIVLPGLLYTALAGWAWIAGWPHALDVVYVTGQLNDLWRRLDTTAPTGPILALTGVLSLAVLAGLTATAVAQHLVHRLWIIRGPRRWITHRRQVTERSWTGRTPRPPSRYLPECATVIGERFRLVGERVHAQYGLSTLDVWPRLWLLAGPDTRTLITTAHHRYLSDTALTAWALLVLPWTWHWWPAAPIAAAGILIGYTRARTSSATLATLIEATIDTHQHPLAANLGITLTEGRITPAEGNQINNILTKRA